MPSRAWTARHRRGEWFTTPFALRGDVERSLSNLLAPPGSRPQTHPDDIPTHLMSKQVDAEALAGVTPLYCALDRGDSEAAAVLLAVSTSTMH